MTCPHPKLATLGTILGLHRRSVFVCAECGEDRIVVSLVATVDARLVEDRIPPPVRSGDDAVIVDR
jgi:hypothetical protein